jgi:hypothetical protein
MTDRSIETSAQAATTTDADASEGLGLAQPAEHGDHLVAGSSGEAGDTPVPAHDERNADSAASVAGAADADAPTEGARSVQETHAATTAQVDTD